MPATHEQLQLLLESAYLWMSLGQEDVAEVVLDGLCQLDPGWAFPWLAKALLAELRQDYRKALQLLRTASQRATASEEAVVRAHLAEALLVLGKSQEALRELEAAAEHPEEPSGRWAKMRLDALK